MMVEVNMNNLLGRTMGIALFGYLIFSLANYAQTSPLGMAVGLNVFAMLVLATDCGYRSSAMAQPDDPH
jgi:hypothetical protein